MIWRESLPARTALVTAALLALTALLATAAAYVVTALLVRQGVDAALRAALPAQTASLAELLHELEEYEEEDEDDWDRRSYQVLTGDGVIAAGSLQLPVDRSAVQQARTTGEALHSLVPDARTGRWRARTGPEWWQALTPAPGELRVLYAAVPYEGGSAVLQVAAPLGTVGDTLPSLLRWLLALAGVQVLIAGAISWRMAAGLYRPLQAVTATAADISPHTPGLRIPQMWDDSTLRRLIGVLNAMIARLQEAHEAQGRFVSAAAHELRSPLAALRTELEVTLRQPRTAEEYRAALEVALEESLRLSALSEHLLLLARYERGASIAMEPDLPLAPLLERAAAEVRKVTGGEVQITCPAALTIDGDALALERLVTNLARNGIEAGGAPVRILAREEGDQILLRVSDQGRGIPPEALPRIFEPFFRGDPARDRRGGAGLGLTIVRTVVDLHGGSISVRSQPGSGTTVDVQLPRRQRGLHR